MWRKTIIGGVVGTALLGTSGLAVAAANGTTSAAGSSAQPTSTATASANPTPGTAGATKQHAKRTPRELRLNKVQHAEWVTKDKTGGFVTREAIRGDITSVSPTSITVKAQDGVSLTFAVATDTKVHVRAAGKGAATKPADVTITDVKAGQQALVTGTGQGSLTAGRVVVTPS
jgi:hypothetical protein